MNFSIKNVFIILLSLSLFTVLNIPSLKIIFSPTSLINVGAIGGLAFLGGIRFLFFEKEKIFLFQRFNLILLINLIALVFLLYGLFAPDTTLGMNGAFRYLSVYIALMATILFINKDDVKFIIPIQIVWGVILTLYFLFFGLELDTSAGQHYLTLGVPLAVGMLMSGATAWNHVSVIIKILTTASTVLLMIGLLSLSGRAPVLFSFSVLLAYSFFVAIRSGSLKFIIYTIVSTVIALAGALYFVSDYWIDRVLRIFNNLSEEPRARVYSFYLNKVIDNPLGYGLNSDEILLNGTYQHNIFLAFLIETGIIGFILFMVFVVFYVKAAFFLLKNFHKNFMLMSLLLASVYLFMTWNVSFEIASAYMPLVSMLLIIILKEELKKDNKSLNTYSVSSVLRRK